MPAGGEASRMYSSPQGTATRAPPGCFVIMKIHRSVGYVHIDLSGPEATVLLEELENVRGGSKLYKMKQMCEGIRSALALEAPRPSAEERSSSAKKAAEVRWRPRGEPCDD